MEVAFQTLGISGITHDISEAWLMTCLGVMKTPSLIHWWFSDFYELETPADSEG